MSWVARQQAELVSEPVRRPVAPPTATHPGGHLGSVRLPQPELLVALLIGFMIRGWHTWSADFPLNDGGLFYVMVRDIQAAHYHLPAYTAYNGGHIPFGYSPFAFYLTALLNDATGVSLITLFRVVPLLASTACIAALYPLARAMLPSRAAVAAALIAFAIIPRSFVWLIMGGGLTRSFGYLFALLALHQIWMLYTRQSLRYVPLATLFSALTILSHLGTAPFVAFSAALFFLFRGRHRQGIVGSLLIGAATFTLTAPWWAAVIAAHGTAPFLAARATGGSILSDVPAPGHGNVFAAIVQYALRVTGEGRFPLMLVLALVGTVWCARHRGNLVLPAWWITILVLDARAGFTYSAAPIAMLAGIGAVNVIWPFVAPHGQRVRAERAARWSVPRRSALGALGVLVVVSMIAAASRRPPFGAETQILNALAPADRAAMRWIALRTDHTARVLVLTEQPWQIDKVSEWLPVLAERVSVATVQGSEWLPQHAFQTYIRRQSQVAACANAESDCLDSLSRDPALRFTHVYVPRGPTVACCGPLLNALGRDPRFGVIYANAGATIFARR